MEYQAKGSAERPLSWLLKAAIYLDSLAVGGTWFQSGIVLYKKKKIPSVLAVIKVFK